jgi:hypothetical protein
MRGSAAGLTAAGSQLFSEDTVGIVGASEANDYYGWALAAGDFDGNSVQDLDIGVPYEDFGAVSNAGTVNVIAGFAIGGLDPAFNQLWSQGSAGNVDVAETGDTFGYSLAAGNIDGNLSTDLVVGVPNEDIAAVSNAGAIHIIYGPLGGFGNELWSQDSASVLDIAEAGDLFGLSLAAGDFDGNGRHDVVAGIPFEDVGGVDDMGAMNVLYGPVGNRQHFWSQDSAGIFGLGETSDWFGLVNQ